MRLKELLDDLTPKKEFFGFPVVEADWLPPNTAAIFSKDGIVIADLESGEILVVSRESLEKAAMLLDNASRISQVEELEDLLREIHEESDAGVIRKMVEDSGVIKVDFKVI